MEYAWRFQRDHGAMLEEDYPYKSGRSGVPGKSCLHNQSKVIGQIKEWRQIRTDVEEMKDRLML